LRHADFSGVDLTEVDGLSADELNRACGDGETKLPAGVVRPDSWPCDPMPRDDQH